MKEKAIHLLKVAIKNQITAESNSSSALPQSLDQFSANNSVRRKDSKSSEKHNILVQCFDQVSNSVPLYLQECERYLNSTVIDQDSNDDSRSFDK